MICVLRPGGAHRLLAAHTLLIPQANWAARRPEARADGQGEGRDARDGPQGDAHPAVVASLPSRPPPRSCCRRISTVRLPAAPLALSSRSRASPMTRLTCVLYPQLPALLAAFPSVSPSPPPLSNPSRHDNIVNLLRVVAGSRRGSFFFVFEYAEHDLARAPLPLPPVSTPSSQTTRRRRLSPDALNSPNPLNPTRPPPPPGPPPRRPQGPPALHRGRGQVPPPPAPPRRPLPPRPLGHAPRPQAQQPPGACLFPSGRRAGRETRVPPAVCRLRQPGASTRAQRA